VIDRLGVSYRGFVIKRMVSETYYYIYKDNELFSTLALATTDAARRVIDTYLKNREITHEPMPIIYEDDKKNKKTKKELIENYHGKHKNKT